MTVQPPRVAYIGPATRAGSVYFALVFALGALLGTLRVLVLVPRFGELAAVAFELPIMLAASWAVCGWTVRHLRGVAQVGARIVMGGIAFLLLLAAEFALGSAGFGRTFADQLASYRAPAAQLGLMAQIAFALFPLIRMLRER